MAPGNSLVITFCPINWMPLGVVMQQLCIFLINDFEHTFHKNKMLDVVV